LRSGPMPSSVDMALNAMASLDAVGLGQHILLLADSAETCDTFHGYSCYWSSRVLRVAPSDSITVQKFWDWRFRFHYVKKAYLSRLVFHGFSVIQADTDTVWNRDPFPVLRSMPSSLITIRDRGICNAGLVYARPGSRQTRDIIDEVAWRVQLLQHYPETVAKLVHYAEPPYYANSDDQTILDDAVVSAVLRNRSWLSSTFRWEARHRYKAAGVEWATQPEYREHRRKREIFRRLAVSTELRVPWINATRTRITYDRWALPPSNDSFSVAPRALFAPLPYHPDNAVTHLMAARGFKSKVAVLKQIGKWFLGNAGMDALAERASLRRAGARVRGGGVHHSGPRQGSSRVAMARSHANACAIDNPLKMDCNTSARIEPFIATPGMNHMFCCGRYSSSRAPPRPQPLNGRCVGPVLVDRNRTHPGLGRGA